MITESIPPGTVRRYILFQLPGIVLVILLILLVKWLIYPLTTFQATILGLLWILKEIVLFPFVHKGYHPHSPDFTDKLIGAEGRCLNEFSNSGRVLVYGEIWRARNMNPEQPLKKGDTVEIIRVEGLLLHVRQMLIN